MNLAHELPNVLDVDELQEPETQTRIRKHRGPKPYMQPRRPSEFGRTYVPQGKPFVPPWAGHPELLPKKPPGYGR